MTLAIAIREADQVILAADKRVCSSSHGVYEERKIHEWGGGWLAFSGDTVIEQNLLALSLTNVTPKVWSKKIAPQLLKLCKDFDADYDVIFIKDGIVYTTEGHFLRESTARETAVGSGSTFAYGYLSGMEAGQYTSVGGGPRISTPRLLAYTFSAAAFFNESVGHTFESVTIPTKGKK